jgi:hypothetical protein
VPDFLRNKPDDAQPPQVRHVVEPPLYQPPVKMPQPKFAKSGCPYCGTHAPTYTASRVSESGWIMFVVLMFFCFPLFWIGLLMRENYRVCSNCAGHLG